MNGSNKIERSNNKMMGPDKMLPEVLAKTVWDAQVLLTDLHKTHPDKAVELGKKLDNNPRDVDFVIHEAKRYLGQLTQVQPRQSGQVVGASNFRSRAVDPSPVPYQNACDNLLSLSHPEFSALKMAGETMGSDYRGEVLFPDVMKGIRELV